MKKLSSLDWVALALLLIGGLNWGLVGILELDLVKTIFGDMTVVSRVVYSLVGLSAVYVAIISAKFKKED